MDKEIGEKVADELVIVLEKVLSKRNLTNLPVRVSRSLGSNLQAI